VIPKDKLCDACYTIVENSEDKNWLECMRKGLLHDRCARKAMWFWLMPKDMPYED
jgi:hypothetical protein